MRFGFNIGAAKDAGTMVDGHTGATALGHLAGTVGKAIDSVEVTGIMSMFGEGGMFSLHNCIIGNIPGSIGETSVIAILIGAVILIATGIASWRMWVHSLQVVL